MHREGSKYITVSKLEHEHVLNKEYFQVQPTARCYTCYGLVSYHYLQF